MAYPFDDPILATSSEVSRERLQDIRIRHRAAVCVAEHQASLFFGKYSLPAGSAGFGSLSASAL
jgi:hypothetical protein